MPCTIRIAREGDAESVASIYAPVVCETAISFESEVPGTAQIGRRIMEALERYPWIVLEREGELAGCGASNSVSPLCVGRRCTGLMRRAINRGNMFHGWIFGPAISIMCRCSSGRCSMR